MVTVLSVRWELYNDVCDDVGSDNSTNEVVVMKKDEMRW